MEVEEASGVAGVSVLDALDTSSVVEVEAVLSVLPVASEVVEAEPVEAALVPVRVSVQGQSVIVMTSPDVTVVVLPLTTVVPLEGHVVT